MSSLGEAIIHLAIDLFHQIRKSKKENIFYSPFSISSALAMTYLGARENTASEMQKVLHFSEITANTNGGATKDPVEKPGNVHHHFQKLLTELKKSTDAYELSVANRLYGRKDFPFLQEYMDNVQKYYLASVESADFVSAAEESRKMINSWVESQTNGRIEDLFPQNSLSGSVLILVNAVYFKGQWQEEFKKENTVQEKFWLNKDTSKPVQMMKQTNRFNFVSLEDVQAKILEIPYKGGELSMMVLLPNEVDGLQEVEDQLTAEKLIAWMSPQNMGTRQVDLYLPQFKMEDSYELVPTLKALGMVDAFRDRVADFSGMTERRDLVVSTIVHKSFVEVTEEGTEAAAATGVGVALTSARPDESFRCDHPFLFLIKHVKTNSILFCGRVSSP